MIDTPESKNNQLPTNINGVDFVLCYRYAAGRRIGMPYFRVRLTPELQEQNGSEYAFVSIAKWGWFRAWKKALITLTVNSDRSKVVRFLTRPPKKENYAVLCARL